MDSIGGWQALAAQVMQDMSNDEEEAGSGGRPLAASDEHASASATPSLRSVKARPG